MIAQRNRLFFTTIIFAVVCVGVVVVHSTMSSPSSPIELSEAFWKSSSGYHDLDHSVQDYVGAQFNHDVENNVDSIIRQWHQAGGTTMENADQTDDDDSESHSVNPFSDDSARNHENSWRAYRDSDQHVDNDRHALHKEVQQAIASALNPNADDGDRDHFDHAPKRWLERSSDRFKEKADRLRESTHSMHKEMEKDKWISRKWNNDYSHDKVLDHNARYLQHHARIKRVRHEARMRIPKFKVKKHAHQIIHRLRHARPETHDDDVSKIFGEGQDVDAPHHKGPHIPSKVKSKLSNEISKQSGWLKRADDELTGKVKVVKGELHSLRGEVKSLASAITHNTHEKREDLLRTVDQNLRKIAESVVHMRAAERDRKLSRQEFETAAKTAKHSLSVAKKTVEGVLHRGMRRSSGK